MLVRAYPGPTTRKWRWPRGEPARGSPAQPSRLRLVVSGDRQISRRFGRQEDRPRICSLIAWETISTDPAFLPVKSKVTTVPFRDADRFPTVERGAIEGGLFPISFDKLKAAGLHKIRQTGTLPFAEHVLHYRAYAQGRQEPTLPGRPRQGHRFRKPVPGCKPWRGEAVERPRRAWYSDPLSSPAGRYRLLELSQRG